MGFQAQKGREARICIVSPFEAYMYIGNRVVRLWHEEGNVRHLVKLWLEPAKALESHSCNPTLQFHSIEDTQPLYSLEDTQPLFELPESLKMG